MSNFGKAGVQRAITTKVCLSQIKFYLKHYNFYKERFYSKDKYIHVYYKISFLLDSMFISPKIMTAFRRNPLSGIMRIILGYDNFL